MPFALIVVGSENILLRYPQTFEKGSVDRERVIHHPADAISVMIVKLGPHLRPDLSTDRHPVGLMLESAFRPVSANRRTDDADAVLHESTRWQYAYNADRLHTDLDRKTHGGYLQAHLKTKAQEAQAATSEIRSAIWKTKASPFTALPEWVCHIQDQPPPLAKGLNFDKASYANSGNALSDQTTGRITAKLVSWPKAWMDTHEPIDRSAGAVGGFGSIPGWLCREPYAR